MFPKLNIDLQELEHSKTDNIEIKDTYKFDFENGDFVFKDGKIQVGEGIEAIKLWIDKILRTEKFRYSIYTKYGIRIEDLVYNSNFSKSFTESELQREITESILSNKNIESIDNFNIQKARRTYNISFNVKLKNNKTFTQEVIL